MAPMTYAYNACYTAALRPDTPRRQSLRGATSAMRFHPRHGAVVLASFAGYIYFDRVVPYRIVAQPGTLTLWQLGTYQEVCISVTIT